MSSHLIESIIEQNFVLSEKILKNRINSIMEKKLYEKKRMVAAEMNEVFGGMNKKEIEDRRKAGYRKASEVLGDPEKKDLIPLGHKYKKIKKKISETVNVEPDPEGRVTGGKPRASKAQPIIRKIAAKAIKMGRKVGGQEFRKGYLSAKKDIETKNILKPSGSQGPQAEPSSDTDETKPLKPWIQRNKNTLMGRDPDYDSKDPKNQSRGGRAGKLARSGIGAVLGAIAQAGE